ncbi:MAG: hypothetical protein R3E95_06130 [Thiolinea sp.]
MFDNPRAFTLDRDCTYTSIRKQSDAETLARGQSFPALGENRRPDPTHTLLRLGNKQKWMALDCGHYREAAVPPPAPSAAESCLPFFDTVDNPVQVG